MVASPKNHMARTPIKKVMTITIPPDFGMGTSWEDRLFGISMILIRWIMRRQIAIDMENRQTAKRR